MKNFPVNFFKIIFFFHLSLLVLELEIQNVQAYDTILFNSVLSHLVLIFQNWTLIGVNKLANSSKVQISNKLNNCDMFHSTKLKSEWSSYSIFSNFFFLRKFILFFYTLFYDKRVHIWDYLEISSLYHKICTLLL